MKYKRIATYHSAAAVEGEWSCFDHISKQEISQIFEEKYLWRIFSVKLFAAKLAPKHKFSAQNYYLTSPMQKYHH